MKTLSVVVPIYNVEIYLPKCVDSLLSQTRKIDEIILVDDGSKDRCGEIADQYACKFDNVHVIHKDNGGLSDARNAGIDYASGDYIGFVDSDDYVESTMYEDLINLLENNSAAIAKSGIWKEKESGELYSPYPENVQLCWNNREALIELNSYQYIDMSFCNAVFVRRLFEQDGLGNSPIRFPKGKLCEDFYIMHEIISRANIIAYTSKPYYHYVQRGNSISRNKNINLAPMDASNCQLDFFKNNFPDLIYVGETACAISYMSIYSSYVRQQVKCPKNLLQELRKTARKYMPSVIQNDRIPAIKKIQVLVFCYCLPLYRLVIKNTSHR